MNNILRSAYTCSGPILSISVRLALALTIVVGCSGYTFAAFINGLETFDGTSLDLNAWRRTNPQYISQNNAALLSVSATTNPATPTQLTTTGIALGPNSSAQIQFTCTAHTQSNFAQFVYLSLTTADSPRGWSVVDSYSVSAEVRFDGSIPGFSGSYYSRGGGDGNGLLYTPTFDTLYSLRLDRLSDTNVRYAFYDSADSLLFEWFRTVPSYPGPLYVAFGADSVDAEFDNLQLSGNIILIPEPSVSALLAMAAVIVPWWRTKTKCGSS